MRKHHRVGIIPFELKDNLLAIMFVTSQTRGRWILPKGKQYPEESHIETCQREGFEEGGVRGVVLDSFPITVVITKQTGSEKIKMPVTYYPFLVTEQVDDWPEAEKRDRHWALIGDAPRVAFKEDILVPIEQFKALFPWIREDAEACRR